jgi:hypothetical protein
MFFTVIVIIIYVTFYVEIKMRYVVLPVHK